MGLWHSQMPFVGCGRGRACQDHGSHPREQIEGWHAKTSALKARSANSSIGDVLKIIWNENLWAPLKMTESGPAWIMVPWRFVVTLHFEKPCAEGLCDSHRGGFAVSIKMLWSPYQCLKNQPQPGRQEGRDSGWGWSFAASPTGISLPGAPGGEAGPMVNGSLQQSRGSQLV